MGVAVVGGGLVRVDVVLGVGGRWVGGVPLAWAGLAQGHLRGAPIPAGWASLC